MPERARLEVSPEFWDTIKSHIPEREYSSAAAFAGIDVDVVDDLQVPWRIVGEQPPLLPITAISETLRLVADGHSFKTD